MTLRPSFRWLALLPLLAGSVPAWAAPPQDPHGILTFQVENDAASTRKGTSDANYTSGLRLGYTTGTTSVPDFLSRFGTAVWGDGVQRISIDLSQQIFTPQNTQITPPDPRDRPYAGYLSLGGTLVHDTDRARSLLGLSVGVVGPWALGREVQNGFHRIIGDTINRGWDYQLRNEPVFQLLASRTWRFPMGHVGGLETDALPSLTAGAGLVRNYAQAGVSFRLGQGLASDFGVPRIGAVSSGADAYTPVRPVSWYVFAGGSGQAVAQDIFLDGNNFRSGPHVSKKVVVGEMQAGLAVMLYGVRVTYTQVWQTESFTAQKAGLFSFGSLSASVRF